MVSSFIVPPTVTAGLNVSVTFTVTNIGNRATRQSEWTDAVFLSNDASLDNGDYLLTIQEPDGELFSAASTHNGILAAGASYTTSDTFTMPFEISGPFYLIASTDTGYGASGVSQSTISPRLNGIGGNATGSVPLYDGTGFNYHGATDRRAAAVRRAGPRSSAASTRQRRSPSAKISVSATRSRTRAVQHRSSNRPGTILSTSRSSRTWIIRPRTTSAASPIPAVCRPMAATPIR